MVIIRCSTYDIYLLSFYYRYLGCFQLFANTNHNVMSVLICQLLLCMWKSSLGQESADCGPALRFPPVIACGCCQASGAAATETGRPVKTEVFPG